MTTKQTYMDIAEDLCGTAFKVAELLEQRDELRAALEKIEALASGGREILDSGEWYDVLADIRDVARAAIAESGGMP